MRLRECVIDPMFLSRPNRRTQGSFQSMEVRHSNFAGFIDYLTGNTYVMVIMSDPTIRK